MLEANKISCVCLCVLYNFNVMLFQLYLPVWHVPPSYPVPVQSQVKLPTVFVQMPLLHGVSVSHSSTSVTKFKLFNINSDNTCNMK